MNSEHLAKIIDVNILLALGSENAEPEITGLALRFISSVPTCGTWRSASRRPIGITVVTRR